MTSLELTDLLVQGKVQAVEYTITMPAHEPAVHRAARREVFGQSPPLAASAQDIQNRIDDLAHPPRVGPDPIRHSSGRLGSADRCERRDLGSLGLGSQLV